MWSAATVLVCALGLLGRSVETFPPIVLVGAPPPGASATVEGFVHASGDTIHLVTSTKAFDAARRAGQRCGDTDALRKIASVIVHEEWHVRHGPDEHSAYDAQLMALRRMGARDDRPLIASVQRAKRTVTSGYRLPATAYLLELTSRTGRPRPGPP